MMMVMMELRTLALRPLVLEILLDVRIVLLRRAGIAGLQIRGQLVEGLGDRIAALR